MEVIRWRAWAAWQNRTASGQLLVAALYQMPRVATLTQWPRLSLQLLPLRVGCLRLAPVGTQFRLPAVTYLWQTRSGLYFARSLDVVEPTRLELVAS